MRCHGGSLTPRPEEGQQQQQGRGRRQQRAARPPGHVSAATRRAPPPTPPPPPRAAPSPPSPTAPTAPTARDRDRPPPPEPHSRLYSDLWNTIALLFDPFKVFINQIHDLSTATRAVRRCSIAGPPRMLKYSHDVFASIVV